MQIAWAAEGSVERSQEGEEEEGEEVGPRPEEVQEREPRSGGYNEGPEGTIGQQSGDRPIS